MPYRSPEISGRAAFARSLGVLLYRRADLSISQAAAPGRVGRLAGVCECVCCTTCYLLYCGFRVIGRGGGGDGDGGAVAERGPVEAGDAYCLFVGLGFGTSWGVSGEYIDR